MHINYKKIINELTFLYKKNALHTPILIKGIYNIYIKYIIYYLSSFILCTNNNNQKKYCKHCRSCMLVRKNKHPDIYIYSYNQKNISVENIRCLYNIVYTTSTLSKNKIIVIKMIENMNIYAFSALLKLIEDFHNNIYFIFTAETIYTIPNTILSRCKILEIPINIVNNNYLSIYNLYDKNSTKRMFFSKINMFIKDLLYIVTKEISVFNISKKWSLFDIKDIIFFIYIIDAQMIVYKFYDNREKNDIFLLSQYFTAMFLTTHINKLYKIMKILLINNNIKSILLIEDILIGYIENDYIN